MHILVLTTSFPNSFNPTSGIFIQRMLEHLPGNIQVTVLVPDTAAPSGRSIFYAGPDRIRVRFCRYAPKAAQFLAHQPGGLPAMLRQRTMLTLCMMPFFSLSMFWHVWKWARKVDLIHAQWAFSGLLAGVAGKVSGVPVVTTLRGSDIDLARRARLFRCLLRWCLRHNNRIVTVGYAMAEQVEQWFPEQKDRISIIANGIGELFRSIKRRPSNGFTICTIGNLISAKQVDLILRAFGEAAKHRSDMKLVVIGDGPEFSYLKRMADNLGLTDRVHFSGRLAPEAVADQLSICHALVLASVNEGRSNVVAEAMTAGVPVIAGAIDGVRELILHRETGLLFEPGNVRQLTDCIQTLQDNPAFARQLGENARLRMRLSGNTWGQCSLQYATLYERLKKKTTGVAARLNAATK